MAATSVAQAHPHVFVEARSELVFDDQKRIEAVRHIWRFDDAFTAFAIQGLDEDGDGTLTQEELQPLAEVNVESLKEYDYFTALFVGQAEVAFSDPTEYWLDFSDGRLTLFYTLPLEAPILMDGQEAEFQVYDPTYFVAFEMTETDPFVLVDAGSSCQMHVERPDELEEGTAQALAQIPSSVRDLPKQFLDVTQTLANTAKVSCT
ncbi:MAG: DUF1007 family protein [Stappiaceae bacterium]